MLFRSMNYFKSINKLKNATYEELLNVRDMGDISSRAVVDFFSNPDNIKILSRLEQVGVNFETNNEQMDGNGSLAGLTFVLTGTLPTMGRVQMEELIKKHGGKISGSVSKKTNYLIAGENAGSKLTKANQLGVKAITEDELLKLIEQV